MISCRVSSNSTQITKFPSMPCVLTRNDLEQNSAERYSETPNFLAVHSPSHEGFGFLPQILMFNHDFPQFQWHHDFSGIPGILHFQTDLPIMNTHKNLHPQDFPRIAVLVDGRKPMGPKNQCGIPRRRRSEKNCRGANVSGGRGHFCSWGCSMAVLVITCYNML